VHTVGREEGELARRVYEDFRRFAMKGDDDEACVAGGGGG